MNDDDLHARIDARVKELGLTLEAASRKAGLNKTYLRKLFQRPGASPRGDSMRKLQQVLMVDADFFLAHPAVRRVAPTQRPTRPNASFPPQYQQFPSTRRIPLLGQTVAGPNGRFVLNGQELASVFCPPNLEGVEGAYAVRIYGTSMEPAYRPGDTVWLDPTSPVRSGDDVVAQILVEGDQVESYIKQFVSRSSKVLRLRQFNPEEGEEHDLSFDAEDVFSVHKIVFHAKA